MPGANARLLVEVAASLGTFREDMGRAAAIADANAKKIESTFASAQSKLALFGRSVVGGFVGALGIGSIVAAFQAVKAAAADEQQSIAQLNTVLETTRYSAGLTAAALEKLGQSIQGTTTFDDDDIRKATTALLRFRQVSGDVFAEVLRTAPNVALVMGVDLPAAAVLLGKAIIDPARGLRTFKEVGVALTEQQIDLAARMKESGDAIGSARQTIGLINDAIGGASESDNTGATGSTKRFTRAWNDLLKSFGRPLVTNTAGLDKVTDFLGRLERFNAKEYVSGLDTFLKFFEVLGAKDETFAFPKLPTPEDVAGKQAEARQAAIGKIIADQKTARDAEYAELKIDLKKSGDLVAIESSAELARKKSAIDLEQDALNFGFSRGLVSIEKYYAETERLSDANLEATVDSIDRQIRAQEKIITAKIPESDLRISDLEAQKDAFAKAKALQGQAVAAGEAAFKRDQQLTQQQILSVERLGDAYGELAEKIAISQGRSADAADIAFERAERENVRRLRAVVNTGSPAAAELASNQLAKIKSLGDLSHAQAELSDETRKYGNTIESLGVAQSRIDLMAQTGAISEIEAINKKSLLAQAYVPLLTAQFEAQKKITDAAIASGTITGAAAEEAINKLGRMKLELDQLASASDVLAKKFNDVFADAFGSNVLDVLDGTKSISQAFRDMAKDITRSLNKIAVDQISQSLFGKGGSASGIGAWFASLLGGSGGSTATSASWAAMAAAGTSTFAGGTNFAPGGWSMVGERGPELVNLPRGAQVISNSELMARRSERGGTTIVQQITVMPGATRQSASQAASQASRALMASQRNM
jgi:Prophage tail length tape measure protein